MKRTKEILKGSILSIMIFAITLMPVYAASSSFTFSMNTNGRVIDGSSNGVFHSLGAGRQTISGTLKTISSSNLSGTSNTVYIQLYSKKGTSYGTVSVKPSTKINGKSDISGSYSSVSKGSYYLYIYRANSDGLSFSGSGKISN